MTDARLLDFFKNGGVYLFDEDDPASERTFYRVEDLMSEPEGEDITQAEVDEDGILCIFFDGSAMSDEEALAKYASGGYVKTV